MLDAYHDFLRAKAALAPESGLEVEPVRNRVLQGDVRDVLKTLPDESVHCVVTSPPYWGLRDYGMPGQLGLEPTPEEYVANLVAVFREIRRVLRRDGTCWVNLGDSYAGAPVGTFNGGGFKDSSAQSGGRDLSGIATGSRQTKVVSGLKPKDLVGIPWRVAFALQADGWWLRSDIIWSKPNPMPESVTDRPTKAHEYVFLLAKSERYYYDAEAVREAAQYGRAEWGRTDSTTPYKHEGRSSYTTTPGSGGDRNRRSVWEIATEPFPEAHFATFPTELVKPCILAGTSEWGCCSVCGAPWRRVVERSVSLESGSGRSGRQPAGKWAGMPEEISGDYDIRMGPVVSSRTTGWQPTCKHEAPTQGALVLDPFFGSGTVGLVAAKAGRDWLGIELSPAYCEMAERRLAGVKARLL